MTLESAIRYNAAFSFATGLFLTIAPGTVADLLDVSISGWLRVLGLLLIAHGAVLVWASEQQSILPWAKLNLAAIAPYPLIMVGVVMVGLVDGSLGRGLLLLDGAIVGLLAIAQWAGLRARTTDEHPVSV